MREMPNDYDTEAANKTEISDEEISWMRLEPNHITPNARYLEVYHLRPNTSYQFRIWANNEVGAGEKFMTEARTVAPTEEKGEIWTIHKWIVKALVIN